MMTKADNTRVMNRRAATIALGASLLAGALPVHAQAYPSKPIRIVVGYPPGGGADAVARALLPSLSQQLGQPVVVDNKPGAAGSIAAEFVGHAAPDGYTLLIADRGMLVFNMGLFKKLSYNPERDFAPIGSVVKTHFVLVGPATAGRANLNALIADAKARPGRLNYAATATGSTAAMELFKQQAGIELVSVPYRGAGPALTAVLAAEVDTMMVDILSALPHIRAGKLVAYGVTSSARLPWLPDTPTLIDSGIKGYEAMTWVGFLAPAGTPPEIVARLNAALQIALKAPDVAQRFEAGGLEAWPGSVEQLSHRMKEEQAVWPDRLRKWGLSAE